MQSIGANKERRPAKPTQQIIVHTLTELHPQFGEILTYSEELKQKTNLNTQLYLKFNYICDNFIKSGNVPRGQSVSFEWKSRNSSYGTGRETAQKTADISGQISRRLAEVASATCLV